jgi:membrane-associated protease RseP (regulator of RpoE activity)
VDKPSASREWRIPIVLFLVTVASVFITGASSDASVTSRNPFFAAWQAIHSVAAVKQGAVFAVSLLSILLAHEFGHYIAARLHRVPASPPHFIPVPVLSPFGTMGAVIRMRGSIKSANALLDIGASGPLAGLCLAIPIYAWGIAHSTLVPLHGEHTTQLGNSLLLTLLDRLGPQPPPGMDVLLSPAAFGAWAGMFVTMINLVPVGQLDGGHVAYSLFGTRQDRIARWIHRGTLAFAFARFAWLAVLGAGPDRFALALRGSLFWLVWFQMLALLSSLGDDEQTLDTRRRVVMVVGLLVVGSFTDGWQIAIPCVYVAGLLVVEALFGVLRPHTLFTHPPTEVQTLSPVRQVVAWIALGFFLLLFMPTPMFV